MATAADCPKCGCGSRVINSRDVLNGVRRRRECQVCGFRWATMEKLAPEYEDTRRRKRKKTGSDSE